MPFDNRWNHLFNAPTLWVMGSSGQACADKQTHTHTGCTCKAISVPAECELAGIKRLCSVYACEQLLLIYFLAELAAHTNAIFDIAWLPGGTKLVC